MASKLDELNAIAAKANNLLDIPVPPSQNGSLSMRVFDRLMPKVVLLPADSDIGDDGEYHPDFFPDFVGQICIAQVALGFVEDGSNPGDYIANLGDSIAYRVRILIGLATRASALETFRAFSLSGAFPPIFDSDTGELTISEEAFASLASNTAWAAVDFSNLNGGGWV